MPLVRKPLPVSRSAEIKGVISLSNDPALVSGNDVLVEVLVTNLMEAAADVIVTLNGVVVTSEFGLRAQNRYIGLVSGLEVGENTIVASSWANPSLSARLVVTNHSSSGPIFSGPHLQPWVCAQPKEKWVTVTDPATGRSAEMTAPVSGLAVEPDANCDMASETRYYYQPLARAESFCFMTIEGEKPCFIPFNPATPPADSDIARFTNDRGDTVRSIIAVERGALNRGMFSLVTFHDPAQPHHAAQPQKGWNNKVVFSFAGNIWGSRRQAPPNSPFFNEAALRAGYMLATTTLTDHSSSSNHAVGAEALMMMRERIVETYGPIRYAVGTGSSGGSLTQLSIASAYPGLLDGLITEQTHADELTTSIEAIDCGLFSATGGYLSNFPTLDWQERDRMSMTFSGHYDFSHCLSLNGGRLQALNPSSHTSCGPTFHPYLQYNPTHHPGGVRCSHLEHNVNLLGRHTGPDGVTRAGHPLDNTGIQYGLLSLRNGTMSPEEFVHINENIGYYSQDHVRVAGPRRSVATLESLERAYRSGMVTDGRYLGNVPIIDLRINETSWSQDLNWRSQSVRQRLVDVHHHHDNHVIWAFHSMPPLSEAAFKTMDSWLSAIEKDDTPRLLTEKVIVAKPAEATDRCLAGTGQGAVQEMSLDAPECPVKFNLSPRQVAGGPATENILKCRLKPLDLKSKDYTFAGSGDRITFTAHQQDRLQKVFADGVCDWGKPGVGQQLNPGWMSYVNGPDAVPLELAWFERPE
nr:DUF6351 family protein [Halopseudomonas xinjiangensis]